MKRVYTLHLHVQYVYTLHVQKKKRDAYTSQPCDLVCTCGVPPYPRPRPKWWWNLWERGLDVAAAAVVWTMNSTTLSGTYIHTYIHTYHAVWVLMYGTPLPGDGKNLLFHGHL